jgi:hypothetical protein
MDCSPSSAHILNITNMPCFELASIADGPNAHVLFEVPAFQCVCTYVGSFHGGKANGPGVVTIASENQSEDNVYEGNFRDGRAHGPGKFRFHFSHWIYEYDGEYKDGAYQNGSFKFSCWTTVGHGKFLDGVVVKHGTMEFLATKSPGKYEGDWDENMCMHGHGKIKFEDGRFYEGEFIHGACPSLGFMVLANGSLFEGEIEKGQPKKGKLLAPNRTIYEGEFLDSLAHGKGVYTGLNEYKYSGDFEKGLPKGQGEIHYSKTKIFKGKVDKNSANGYGVMEIAVESEGGDIKCVYEGDFVDNKLSGIGKISMLDVVYEGEIDNFAKQGKGITKSFDESGQVVRTFEGQFDKNHSIKGIRFRTGYTPSRDTDSGGKDDLFNKAVSIDSNGVLYASFSRNLSTSDSTTD